MSLDAIIATGMQRAQDRLRTMPTEPHVWARTHHVPAASFAPLIAKADDPLLSHSVLALCEERLKLCVMYRDLEARYWERMRRPPPRIRDILAERWSKRTWRYRARIQRRLMRWGIVR